MRKRMQGKQVVNRKKLLAKKKEGIRKEITQESIP